jgi:hypothetical protein
MTKLKPMSAILIAVAMLATPAMARVSHVGSRHLAENIDTSPTPGYFREGDGFRGHESRDVWGHWGAYYGPMIPSVP